LEIKRVGVLGLGTMGAGIAQVCGQAGLHTTALEVNEELVEKGMKTIRKFLKIGVRMKQITPGQNDAALANIKGTTDVDDLKDCDIVIEAVVEDIKIKHALFSKLDSLCKPETIFASNTSSLSITQISVATKRQDRVFGLHFFNPVPMMKLVEIASTMLTDADIVDTLYAFCERIGKIPIKTIDSPGFVVNRLLVPFLNDAAKAFESGVASAEDIDKAMVHGLGHPMGPLRLLDTIGLDVAVMVSEIMYNAFKDPKYAAPPVLVNMVRGGLLGKKSGRGFYSYSKGQKE
jgi:3-hydroxybutyryl-CoA dehydrogenase